MLPIVERDRVFERFYRLDELRRWHTGGAGLGLAICREVLRALGGTIRVGGSQEVSMTTARLSALVTALVFATAPTTSARQAKQGTAPEIPFASVPDFLKLPDDIHFGEVPGVAVDSKGRIYVFSRSGSASGPAYGPSPRSSSSSAPTGKFIREIGRNLYGWAFAHSVRIDRNDNIWAIDKGSDMIVKFNQAGRVEWVFGRRKESADGAEPWEHATPPLAPQVARFRQPTDVAWDSQGNIYISDGYINSRVAKFDRNGDWVMSFGEPGNGPGQFNTPHAIAIDNQDNVYVGDRGNQRVQIFDTNGKYIREWKIEIPPDYTTRAVNGPTPPPGSMDGVGAPEFALHHARPEPGDVPRREHLARPHLQGHARRQGAGCDRASRDAI